MIASVINAIAILIGTALGSFFQRVISKYENLQAIIYNALGLITIVLGLNMAIQSQRILYMALSIIIGAIIGEVLKIERGIMNLGGCIQRLLPDSDNASRLPTAFLNATVLFCVGSLSILGAFQAGVDGNYSLLLTKSVLDGTAAMLLTTTLGYGVGFSALSVLFYQGGLTLAARSIAEFVNEIMVREISAVGGVIIMGIGVSLMGLKKIPSGNFLPALIIIVLLMLADPYLPIFFKG